MQIAMFLLRLALQILFQNFLIISAQWIYLQNYSKNLEDIVCTLAFEVTEFDLPNQ